MPDVPFETEYYDNALFISREGAAKVMKSGTITEYPKGGLQNVCNYQSTAPFVEVQKFINTHNMTNPEVKIKGEMVSVTFYLEYANLYNTISVKFIVQQDIYSDLLLLKNLFLKLLIQVSFLKICLLRKPLLSKLNSMQFKTKKKFRTQFKGLTH